ncbi:MAG: ABC transporter ATP-binding protein [Chloroflexi bacterium]|nr:ABC transporter ATP-binding protein [Chloroflexota bacterium]
MRYLLRLLTFLRPYKKQLAVAYFALIISTLLSLAVPRLLGDSIDKFIEKDTLGLFVLLALVVLAFAVARAIFAYIQTYISEYISQRVAYDLRNALYDHLQHLSYAYHDKQQTGQLMSRATADVEGVRWFISLGLVRSVYLIVLFAGVSAVLIITNWKLGLISLGALPLVSARAILVSRRLRWIWRNIQEMTGQLGALLQENLSGARVVRAFSREDYESAVFASKARDLADENVLASRIQASNAPLMNFIFALITGAILWVGGREVAEGRLTPGELAQFVFYLILLAFPVRIVGFVITLFSRAASSGERIFEILDAESPVQEKPGAVELPRVRGHVVFQGVSFRYDSSVPTLDDINFEISPGQVVALLGATGSGKTTIVHLIPRFYDVSQGSITIDGLNVGDVTLKSLRREVGIVQQEMFLFADSIRNNIAYGAYNATMEEVERAAEAARLTDFIESLPQGYDTWVGERGTTLSGGQKQRIAIARTLLMDPRILILDDSTASVDTETEMLIQQALKELIRGRTTFIIAQRLSTVRNADVILVLENGKIVERGSHQELLSRGGIYQKIYELQLRPQEAASDTLSRPALFTAQQEPVPPEG